TLRGAPAPCAPRARGLQGKTSWTCSWLHSLKSWSLLKSRGGSKSYARQFEVKYRWVTENLDDVCLYLSEQLKCPVEGDGVGYAMVTHHPLLIATRITGFSCVNLSQFMRGYKAEGQWALSRIMRT
ncbi:hypothetical protein, partial [Rhodanobacter terrae]